MTPRARTIVLASLGVIVCASPGWAGQIAKSNQVACQAPASVESASATIKQVGDNLQFKFKAKGLTPGAIVNCGYGCFTTNLSSTTGCGVADDDGKWSSSFTLPVILFGPCVGVVPLFFQQGSPTCAPSIVD